MRRMTTDLKLSSAAGLVLGLSALMAQHSACVLVECQSINDCAAGEVCDIDGTCVTAPPPPAEGEGEGEGDPGEGEGEGEGDVDPLVDTDAPITMFVRDPNNANRALLGEYDGSLDQVRSFDLATGDIANGELFDYASQDNCAVDTIVFLDETALQLNDGDEVWFSCDLGRVDVQYDNDFAQLYTQPGMAGAELSVVLGADDGLDTVARVITANRGGTQLYVVALNPATDQINAPRTLEPVSETFTGIAGIFKIVENDNQYGDIVLVFDRSTPPRFVPVQRDLGQQTWHGPPLNGTNLVGLDLPANTHFAFFRQAGTGPNTGIEDLDDATNVSATAQNTPNVVVLRPEEGDGEVNFLRYESELQSPGANAFRPLTLGASDPIPATPPAEDRILFEERVLDGEPVFFYALTTSDHVWRFPIHADQNEDRFQDVRRVQLNDTQDLPVGLIPIGDALDEAWVALGNRNRIDLVPFLTDL